MEEFEHSQQLFGSIIDATEHSTLQSKRNERILTAENRSLQVELNLSKLALDKTIKAHRKANQSTPFDRSIDRLLSQSLPAPVKPSSSPSKPFSSTTITAMNWTVDSPSKTAKTTSTGTSRSKRLLPLQTAGDRLLEATFPRDRKVAEVNRQEDDFVTDVSALKLSLLNKYFKLMVAKGSADGRVSPRAGKAIGVNSIDLSQCELRDHDIQKVYYFLSLLSCREFRFVLLTR